MRIHLEGDWTRFSTHFIDATIDTFQWIAGIFLGCFIYSYITRWFLENVKIDYSIPQSYMVQMKTEDGKKWLAVNPSNKWNLLEAILIYLTWRLGKNYKNKIQESDIKRVKLIRRIWLVTGSIIFILGTASAFFLTVSADEKEYQTEVLPYLIKIQIPEYPKKYYAAEKEEPKQEEPKLEKAQAEPEQEKPETELQNTSEVQSYEEQKTPEIKKLAKENKKRLLPEKPKYTYADHRRRSNDTDRERLSKIELNKRLEQINNELLELKSVENLPRETVKTIDQTLDGVNTLLRLTMPGR